MSQGDAWLGSKRIGCEWVTGSPSKRETSSNGVGSIFWFSYWCIFNNIYIYIFILIFIFIFIYLFIYLVIYLFIDICDSSRGRATKGRDTLTTKEGGVKPQTTKHPKTYRVQRSHPSTKTPRAATAPVFPSLALSHIGKLDCTSLASNDLQSRSPERSMKLHAHPRRNDQIHIYLCIYK